MFTEPIDNLRLAHRHQVPCIQSDVQSLRTGPIGRKLMRVTIQQLATIKRQRLAAELRHIIGPTVCQILPIRVMRKIDRTESLDLNRIVRLQTLEQVECGPIFKPPIIVIADHTMQMLAIERSQAVLQMG